MGGKEILRPSHESHEEPAALTAAMSAVGGNKMRYDDASWHSEGDFPSDLTVAAAATHTGFYVAWAILTGLASDELNDDFEDAVKSLRSRQITPSRIYMMMDSKFTDQDLSDEGNLFTSTYFDFEKGAYLNDYDQVLCRGIPSMYHVADNWKN